MKEKVTYVCEKCGAEYIDENAAVMCESRHLTLDNPEVQIIGYGHELISKRPDGIPVEIYVQYPKFVRPVRYDLKGFVDPI